LIHKRRSTDGDKVIVTFEIPRSIWAEHIHLVGDFNHWDRESLPFRRTREGDWQIELEMETGSEHRFGYLLDGAHWRYDWHADKYVPSPNGGFDSVVVAAVPGPPTLAQSLGNIIDLIE
jgi:hypothetical protein